MWQSEIFVATHIDQRNLQHIHFKTHDQQTAVYFTDQVLPQGGTPFFPPHHHTTHPVLCFAANATFKLPSIIAVCRLILQTLDLEFIAKDETELEFKEVISRRQAAKPCSALL
ncbi:hypothetical protein BaRGS_00034504 [Batillaria attramentaria]|uniref:Uncharacterized protein n=1 Tax=Batillaria attramentaria TaxID=370345 RepID=A0ABD0JHC0_9CAEN